MVRENSHNHISKREHVSTQDDVERFNAVSDGVIVGSKIVKALHEGQVAEIADFIRQAVAYPK